MPIALETAVASYLNGSQPSITAVASQPAQPRTRIVAPAPRQGLTSRATELRESVPTASNDNPIPESAKTPADIAIAQLIRLEQFDADWDGSDAAKPIVGTLKEARAFIRALAPESVVPRVTLHADGHAILFIRKPDVYAELEFLGNNKIGFYARRGEQKWSDEISFDGRSLPEGLSQIGLSL
jgi:hypothetical protein